MRNERGIRLSPKYGVNPTIAVCFWCGKEKNELAFLGRIGDGRKGEDIEAPKYSILDFEPCDECRKNMAKGFTVMEATTGPNDRTKVPMQDGVYPTGHFVVLKNEAAERIFGEASKVHKKAFMLDAEFSQMFSAALQDAGDV